MNYLLTGNCHSLVDRVVHPGDKNILTKLR